MNIKQTGYFLIILILVSGCSMARQQRQGPEALLKTSEKEELADAASALTSVTNSLSDKNMTEQELYEAARKMKDDPDAQQALEAISTSFDRKQVQVKYSPATGKRYSVEMEFDPETGVRLLPVE